MPSRPPPERSIPTRDDESIYRFQRGFTAWIVAIYTFVMTTLGSIAAVSLVTGQAETWEGAFARGTVVMALLIPTIWISSIVWTKVYGHKV